MIFPYLIHIPLLIFLVILLKRRSEQAPLLSCYKWGVGLKLAAGIAVGLIYKLYYNSLGDTLFLHQYSTVLTNILWNDPPEYFRILFSNVLSQESKEVLYYYEEPRAFFYLKILNLLNIFTFSNYWINSLYLSLFSFYGAWVLSNTLIKVFSIPKMATALAFFFLPSFVFWTSGLLKESLVTGALFLIIAFTLRYLHMKGIIKPFDFLLLLILLYCCWKIKFYYLLVTLPILASYCAVVLASERTAFFKKPLAGISLFLVVFALLTGGSLLFIPGLTLNYIAEIINHSYHVIYNQTAAIGKTAYELEGMRPEISSIIRNAPEALLAGLFRPFIWESPFSLSMLAAMENFLILVLLPGKIYSQIKNPVKLKIETIAVIIYLFITAALMALIAPNWGTLARYKTAFLPFWVMLLSVNNPLFAYAEELWKKAISVFRPRSIKEQE